MFKIEDMIDRKPILKLSPDTIRRFLGKRKEVAYTACAPNGHDQHRPKPCTCCPRCHDGPCDESQEGYTCEGECSCLDALWEG